MRKASSMIELVIAIVIMGIAMMTLPMMLTKVQENNAFSLQQESILMARTQLGDITTHPWDENTIQNGIATVLDVSNGDSELTRYPDANSTRRVGHAKGNKRRKFNNDEVNASIALGSDGSDLDDIDDFNTNVKNLVDANDTNTTLGYKLSDINLTIAVNYVSDDANYSSSTVGFNFPTASTPPSTNLKMVTIVLKNSLSDNNITLRTYVSNIGANQLLRKDFP